MSILPLSQLQWLFLLFISLALYLPMNRKIVGKKSVKIFFDDKIPVISFMVLPYSFLFPFLFFFVWYSWGQPVIEFQRAMLSLVLCILSSYVTFFFFPTLIEEIEVQGQSLWDKILRKVYQHDRRVNTFPSGHVFLACIAQFFLWKWTPLLGFIVLPLSLTIILSTLYTKQHYILDVISGVIWAIFGIGIAQLLIY